MNTATTPKLLRTRFSILVMLFVCVVINYMDRSNISIAASELGEDLQLTPVQLGLIFSAFSWTYSALQIPGGILVDFIRPRILYAGILVFWSLATLMQGFANSFSNLLWCRLGIGVFEAPSYPTNNRIVTSWFPEQERASAIAIYTSGQYIGLAFLSPILVAIQNYMGWRGLFIISGITGIVWGVVWYLFYRDPDTHKSVTKDELNYIVAGGGLVEQKTKNVDHTKFNIRYVAQVFRYRKLWGVFLGQFALGGTFWFFLTWFPTYLVKYRGISFVKSGFLASIPFLAAFTGILLSGFISDFLFKKGKSLSVARKIPVIIGMILSASIIGANFSDRTSSTIFFLSLSFFGTGFASITWVFISAIAPRHLIGITGGVFNFIGTLSGIVVPIVIGYLIEGGDFKPSILFISTLALAGACSYIFLVGKVERIKS